MNFIVLMFCLLLGRLTGGIFSYRRFAAMLALIG
jgi:hypothetical protein